MHRFDEASCLLRFYRRTLFRQLVQLSFEKGLLAADNALPVFVLCGVVGLNQFFVESYEVLGVLEISWLLPPHGRFGSLLSHCGRRPILLELVAGPPEVFLRVELLHLDPRLRSRRRLLLSIAALFASEILCRIPTLLLLRLKLSERRHRLLVTGVRCLRLSSGKLKLWGLFFQFAFAAVLSSELETFGHLDILSYKLVNGLLG